MAECSHTTNCALFPMISVNSALKVWRTFYCEGKWTECARYKLSLENKAVPSNLLPNGKVIDLDVGRTVAKPAPAPATKPVEVKTEASTRGELEKIEKDIASIDLDAPVSEATVPQPAASAAPADATSGDTMSYYLRMQIHPDPGVMTEIIRSLGRGRVRIDAVTEKKGLNSNAPSYLIVLTDQVDDSTLNAAAVSLQSLSCVVGEVKRIALEKMNEGQLV